MLNEKNEKKTSIFKKDLKKTKFKLSSSSKLVDRLMKLGFPVKDRHKKITKQNSKSLN
jgi:hypothetical protein